MCLQQLLLLFPQIYMKIFSSIFWPRVKSRLSSDTFFFLSPINCYLELQPRNAGWKKMRWRERSVASYFFLRLHWCWLPISSLGSSHQVTRQASFILTFSPFLPCSSELDDSECHFSEGKSFIYMHKAQLMNAILIDLSLNHRKLPLVSQFQVQQSNNSC